MASIRTDLKYSQLLSTELPSGELAKKVSSASFRKGLMFSQSAFLKSLMVLAFFLFCFGRRLHLVMTIWSWSLIPGPVSQLFTESGDVVRTSSRMFFFLVGLRFNCSMLCSMAILRSSSQSCLSGFVGVCARVVQSVPWRLKSPASISTALGNFSLTIALDLLNSSRLVVLLFGGL